MRHRWLAACLLVGCGSNVAPPPPSEQHTRVGEELVGRVGATNLPRSLVAQVAQAEKISPKEAFDALVRDALLAEAARKRGLLQDRTVARDLRAAKARRVAVLLRDDPVLSAPPSDVEVDELSKARWQVVDAPESVRVLHVLVVRPKKEALLETARAYANDVLSTMSAATSDADFQARAKALSPPKGIDTLVQPIPAFSETGIVTEMGRESSPMHETFAKAAWKLAKSGDQSGLVETPFGHHVIRLVERVPRRFVPIEERKAMFAAEIKTRRQHQAYEAVLQGQAQRNAVSIEAGADALMNRIPLSAEP